MGKSNKIGAENVKALMEIASAIRSMNHGSIEIIVQDFKIIQINKTDKIRLDKKS